MKTNEEAITEELAYNSNKVEYLKLLQEPISRMSSTSAIFKGFSATILAGLASASFTDISLWALMIGLLPILPFFALDVYYLSLERRLRYRYKLVAENKVPVDFSISTKLSKVDKKKAKTGVLKCIASPSIWIFYLITIGCATALFVLKALGTI